MKLEKPNKNPFRVPKDYFENLSVPLKPIKNNGFSVPKDYFQTLETRILEQTIEKPKEVHRRKRIPLQPWAIGIAASIALVIGFWWFQPNNNLILVDEETVVAIETYISADNTNWNYLEVAEALELEAITEEDINFDNQEVLQYLENSFDPSEDYDINHF